MTNAVKATAPWYDCLKNALQAIATNTRPTSDHGSSGSADAHSSLVTSPEAK